MATFKLKADLPTSTRQEIDRVLAIGSGQRTTEEAAFIAKIGQDYLYNEVLLRNVAGEIVIAKGRTVPTGDSGFSVGATFVKEDTAAGLNSKYTNVGTNEAAVWAQDVDIASANDVIRLEGDGVPVDYTDGDPAATGEGIAGKGSTYIDYTNGKLYINGGTKAEPVWKIVTSA